VAGGNWGRLGAPQQHLQPLASTVTNPRQHQPKDLNKTRRDIHLVEIRYCEDTRPQNQLNAAKEQHKGLCNILQGASVTLHIILLGVGGTFYNTHTLKPFKNWVSILKELRSLPPSSVCTLWTLLLNLSILDVPFPVLLSTLIRSRFQAKPATLLIPIDYSFPFCGGGALQYSVPKWLLFLT